MTHVRVAGVGVLGPGLGGWEQSVPVLRGDIPYAAYKVEPAPPRFLSARERRRTGLTSRVALSVADEAVTQSGIPAQELSSVFATANGDGQIIHELLESCTMAENIVSPTQFHNSVNNAAVGYWAIGVSSNNPSTCIAAHDFTFGAALVKSLTHVICEDEPVLAVIYDAPFPEPLNGARPMASSPFGMALVLTPARMDLGFAELRLVGTRRSASEVSRPRNPMLNELWAGNPAARGLPVLETLAAAAAATLVLEYPADGQLWLELEPC